MNAQFEVEVSRRSRISVSCPEPDAEVQESYWAKVRHEGALIAQVEAVFASYSAGQTTDPAVSFPEPITVEQGAAGHDLAAIKEAIRDEILKAIKNQRSR